ncbi:MAG: phenylalanine--tRNA ligase subunit beta [Armatimonadetes bacterium]|nr:phenylalanine--tRNA ligase subunit beta [Armatimonadota bacterium]
MRIPTEWLKQYVDPGLDAGELADLLIRLGLEIEEIEAAPGGLGGEVLVAEITPNRGDCLSLVGIAYEVAAATGAELNVPRRVGGEGLGGELAQHLQVRIEAPDLCPRYSARVVRGVQAGPSPLWMQQRLLACGQRPIDILVDVTNYLLFELGQPLHAFDYGLLGETIVVRRAEEGEVIVTLDGVKRTLTSEQLLITDGERAVALAGVMGGANTEVSAATRDVLLEGAHFYGPNIRRTARTLGLESESSYRFARTVDPNLTILALNRACELLAEHAGGQPEPGVVDVATDHFEPRHVHLRPDRCNQFLGTQLSVEEIGEYLTALALRVELDGEELSVVVPTRRPDLEREVDLIEEVARLHGYDQVPVTVPRAARSTGRLNSRQRNERRLRELLLGCGLNEVWTFSLTSPAAMARGGFASDLDQIGAVRLTNALNEEYSLLRWSMLPSMLEVLGRNAAVHGEPVRIFEIGRTYAGLDPNASDEVARCAGRLATGQTATTLPLAATEEQTLAVAMTGKVLTSDWNLGEQARQVDFYEAKGVLELILAELKIEGVTAEAHEEPVFEPGRAARLKLGEQVVAVLGEVAQEVRQRYDIHGPVVLAEANLGCLLEQADTAKRYQALPRQPAALRDLALVVADEVPQAAVAEVIRQAAGAELESLTLFDVYRGRGLAGGTRSLAYNLRFRHPERTLTDVEVDQRIASVVEAVTRECGASLRE